MLYRYFKERYSLICHMIIERYSIRIQYLKRWGIEKKYDRSYPDSNRGCSDQNRK